MTAGQLRRTVTAALAGDSAAFECDQLMMHLLHLNKTELLLDSDRVLSATQEAALFALVERRRGGEPLQYILGEWEFYSLPFTVGPGVLIPRADTETLVDAALVCLAGHAAPVVADLCSGSGCVAEAIAHCRPDAAVHAFELSEEALPYLHGNLVRNHIDNVTVSHRDVLAAPPAGLRPDLIVSNPPYIPAAELPNLQLEVRHEPEMALDGGEDGLLFYRAITARWLPLLSPGGAAAVEVGIGQADDVHALFTTAGLDCTVREDMNGLPRVVAGLKR